MERDYTESFLKPTEEERQSSLLIITIFFVGVSIFITFFFVFNNGQNYLHNLYSEYCPQLCCFYLNVLAIVSYIY